MRTLDHPSIIKLLDFIETKEVKRINNQKEKKKPTFFN